MEKKKVNRVRILLSPYLKKNNFFYPVEGAFLSFKYLTLHNIYLKGKLNDNFLKTITYGEFRFI